MVGKTSQACRFEAGLAGFADGRPPPFVLVVRGHIPDAGVKAYAVPVPADDGQLGSQDGRVGDALEVGVLALEVTVEALDPSLVGRRARPAEVLGDGAQRHELAGRTRRHLGTVVRHRQQDRPALVVDGGVDQAVGSGLDQAEETFGGQGVGEDDLDLRGGLLRRDNVGDPLAADEVLDDGQAGLGPGEMGGVVDPDLVRALVHPLGEGLAHRVPRAKWRVEIEALSSQDASHRRRRHPHPFQVGAAVGQRAIAAVDVAPLVVQRHDLGHLVIEQTVPRAAPGARSASSPAARRAIHR
jgi:hypothetical protein